MTTTKTKTRSSVAIRPQSADSTSTLGRQEVRIAVAAAGVNRPDILQVEGRYPPPPDASPIPGLEVAGTVLAVGSAVTRWRVGDAVCALVNGGGYAATVVADAGLCLPVPSAYSLPEAATLPEALATLWMLLGEVLRPQRAILIHGGTGGMGHYALQIAKAFGLYVYTTVGSAEKATLAGALGADSVLNYRTDDFVESIRNNVLYNRVNVVLDCIGAPYLNKNFKVLAHDGVLVQLAFQGGDTVTASMLPVLLKRLTWCGATLRSLPLARKRRLLRAVEKKLWPLLTENGIRPLLYDYYPLDKWRDAHKTLAAGGVMGKIVLVP